VTRGATLRLCVACGCKAQPNVPQPDDAAPDDLAVVDFATDTANDGAVDLGPDLACPPGPEICNNGCDDDRNGYTDGDDPACTPQVLATFSAGSAGLQRLLLGSPPSFATLDTNAVLPGSFAHYERSFAPYVYLVTEGSTRQLRRLSLAGNGGKGSFVDISLAFAARDVCVFNNELILVERIPATLHRFMADGMTEIATFPIGATTFATACASDGDHLYVATHDNIGNPSQFLILDKGYQQVAGSPVAMPDALVSQGMDRCLDFAWTQRASQFYGLFVASNFAPDAQLSADQIYPFAFDGGIGDPIDAGTLHGIGAFLP
jgi:hypothetical protein